MYRYDVINFIADKINAKYYLEIGIQGGVCFQNIKVPFKLWVDPSPAFKNTSIVEDISDNFFARAIKEKMRFDLIFIDGLHTYEQVKRDFENALKVLNKWWVIIFHDMNPTDAERARSFADGGLWNGDCYKLAIDLYNQWYDFSTVEDDQWCLIFKSSNPIRVPTITFELSYETLDSNRQTILNLIQFEWLNSLF